MDRNFICRRFEEIKQTRHYTARWLSDTMKLNRYTVNKILAGDVRKEKDMLIFRAVLQKIGITEQDFFHGHEGSELQPIPFPEPAGFKVPLYGEIPAGNPVLIAADTKPVQWVYAPPGEKRRELFALRVSGQSMAPHFLPGDLIYLEPLNIRLGVKDPTRPVPMLMFERLNGRIVAAVIDNESTLKQLKVVGEGEKYALLLKPLNPDFGTITVKGDNEVVFQGAVVKMLREI